MADTVTYRPVTPLVCPQCHALWLFWPKEQSGGPHDSLNLRSPTACHYCERADPNQLERLGRFEATTSVPSPIAGLFATDAMALFLNRQLSDADLSQAEVDSLRTALQAMFDVFEISPPIQRSVLTAIIDELGRAVRKFPTWPSDPLHAVAVLGEEFGELTKAALQHTYEPHKASRDDVRTEAIQTAAMALRFVLSLGDYAYQAGHQHEQKGGA